MEAWGLAQPLPADHVRDVETRRSLVRFRLLGGGLDATRLSSLQALIEADLSRMDSALIVDSTRASVSAWVSAAERDPRILLLAVLDTRPRDYWQVTIVDTSRGRAIRRRLPGGVAEDAAALEAVASIVVSAAAALRDGLEVASRPVQEVLREAEASAPPRVKRSPPTPPGHVTQSEEQSASAPAPIARRMVTLDVALLGAGATYEKDEPFLLGVGLAFGSTFVESFMVRASAVRFRDAVFDSPFGRFRTRRTSLGLAVAPHVGWKNFELEPEARLVAELIERSSTRPVTGVSAYQDQILSRFGGTLGLRGRVFANSYLGFELFVGGGYLPRPIRFIATPEGDEIAELWPWLLRAELGVGFRVH